MNRYDFHKDFIKSNNKRLAELFNELHVCYDTRKSLHKSIKETEKLFNAVGVNFSLFNAIMEGSNKIVLSKYARSVLPEEIVKTVDSFIYLNVKKIPNLKNEIKIVGLLCYIPDKLFFKMQYIFNREVSNNILRGYVYSFGQGLSQLCINYVKRSPNSKPCIDWGESNKLKKRLSELGYAVKTKDNPEGAKWLLFRTDDGYCFWNWIKKRANTHNRKMYKFRAIATNNECTDYNGTLTQEEILNKNIGTFDKMMALLKLNPLMKKVYELQ